MYLMDATKYQMQINFMGKVWWNDRKADKAPSLKKRGRGRKTDGQREVKKANQSRIRSS